MGETMRGPGKEAAPVSFETLHQSAYVETDIGFMLVKSQFHSDFMAHDVMTFHLDIFSHFLAAQPDGIQTQIIDFISGQPVLFEKLYEPGMRGCKSQAGRVHELLFVIAGHLNPLIILLCIAVIPGNLFCQQTVEHVKPVLDDTLHGACQFRLLPLQCLQIVTFAFQPDNFQLQVLCLQDFPVPFKLHLFFLLAEVILRKSQVFIFFLCQDAFCPAEVSLIVQPARKYDQRKQAAQRSPDESVTFLNLHQIFHLKLMPFVREQQVLRKQAFLIPFEQGRVVPV